jgi:hypothetical protein
MESQHLNVIPKLNIAIVAPLNSSESSDTTSSSDVPANSVSPLASPASTPVEHAELVAHVRALLRRVAILERRVIELETHLLLLHQPSLVPLLPTVRPASHHP